MPLPQIEKNILPWFVYIVRCVDNTLYCGITKDIEQRLEMHNGILKGGAKYTRGRRPVELVIYTQVATQSEATLLEIFIKKLPKKQKIPFVKNLHKSLLSSQGDGFPTSPLTSSLTNLPTSPHICQVNQPKEKPEAKLLAKKT